jgi:hypothetical protein
LHYLFYKCQILCLCCSSITHILRCTWHTCAVSVAILHNKPTEAMDPSAYDCFCENILFFFLGRIPWENL